MLRTLFSPRIRYFLSGAALLLAALALVRYSQQAMEGAKTGIALCGSIIIPSLFPFFILSSLVVELGLASGLGRLLQPVMYPLFRVNGTGASALVLGFIGGYPVGARTAVSLYRKGLCSKTECERLMAFCNNSGPAFILGAVGSGIFADPGIGILLCAVHLLSSLSVGVIFRFYGKTSFRQEDLPHSPPIQTVHFSGALAGSVKAGLQSMLNICAFVIFFSVVTRLLSASGIFTGAAGLLSALLGPLGFSEDWGVRLFTGILEISGGMWSLAGMHRPGAIILAAFFLGWAGLSVHFQVFSFLEGTGISPRPYLTGKVFHAGISAVMMWGVLRCFPQLCPVSFPVAGTSPLFSFPAASVTALLPAAAGLGVVLLAGSVKYREIGGGKIRRTRL